jgi:hypothetical protein
LILNDSGAAGRIVTGTVKTRVVLFQDRNLFFTLIVQVVPSPLSVSLVSLKSVLSAGSISVSSSKLFTLAVITTESENTVLALSLFVACKVSAPIKDSAPPSILMFPSASTLKVPSVLGSSILPILKDPPKTFNEVVKTVPSGVIPNVPARFAPVPLLLEMSNDQLLSLFCNAE